MVGGETSCRQTMPLMARQVPKGARTSKRRQLKKSSCRSTGDGARAQESQELATDPVRSPREGDVQEHAPRLGEHPLARWSLPHEGERRGETGRGGPTRNLARLRGPKPDLGMHTLKCQGGRGRGSGWCHPQKGDLLRAPRPLRDRGPGTGAGHPEGVRDPGAPTGGEPRIDRHLRVREERKAHFRW